MTSFEEAVNIVSAVLGGKENRIQWQVGYLGDGAGAVLTARENYLLVRYPYENSPAVPVYCGTGIAAVDGLRVIVGYLPWEPGRFQIITQSDQRIDVVGTATSDETETPVSPGSGTGYAPGSGPHTVNHQYLGVDPLAINWRQVTPLGVFPVYPASMSVQIRGGYIPRPGADVFVSDQTVDLTAYIPVAGALYALISYNSVGTVVVTAGTPNLGGFNALTSADMPDTPAGNWRSAAVVLYAGQTSVQESRSEIDIYDVRFPEEQSAGTLALTDTHIFVGNASNVATDVAMSNDATMANTGALTIANDAVTYAKMQNISATQRALGRNTAGAGDTEEVTASQILDWIGSTRGAILYRGASGWAILAPGTAGHSLTSNGAGADPSYQFVGREVLMADGITPPDPLLTEDETDWLWEG